MPSPFRVFFFFFNDTATTEIYTLSLHDALPISAHVRRDHAGGARPVGRDTARAHARHPRDTEHAARAANLRPPRLPAPQAARRRQPLQQADRPRPPPGRALPRRARRGLRAERLPDGRQLHQPRPAARRIRAAVEDRHRAAPDRRALQQDRGGPARRSAPRPPRLPLQEGEGRRLPALGGQLNAKPKASSQQQNTMSLRERLIREPAPNAALFGRDEAAGPGGGNVYQEMKARLHRAIINRMDLTKLGQLDAEQLHAEVSRLVEDMIAAENVPLSVSERERLIGEVRHELFGLGPIEPLLADPEVSDILVNSPKKVYIERRGKLELTSVEFKDDEHLMRVIERIVSTVGRRIDESSPMVDARLSDGSRVNAIIPPLSIDGPVLSSYIPDDQRIVTIEDSAELQMQQPHVVRLETRPPNIEGKGEVTQRDLVKNALRMRPDRIVIGEVRSAEAIDMLQAMNTGHDGSLTTVHANTPRDALARLETMIQMTGMRLSDRAMRQQVASALDLVIQAARLSDGTRRITSISEITGMEGETITMQEIFHFERKGVDKDGRVVGRYRPTGVRPRFAERLKQYGMQLPRVFFEEM